MYYYLYKITNLINNNYYFGRRKSKVLPEKDRYFGSGLGLKAAILKYGKENFKKQIIECYLTFEELLEAEKKLITIEVVQNSSCYNQSLGGPGGVMATLETKAKMKNSLKEAWARNPQRRLELSKRDKETGLNKWWTGKNRSEEDKLAKSIAAKESVKSGKHASKQVATCPHCNYTTGIGNAKRWHFDNCKQKESIV